MKQQFASGKQYQRKGPAQRSRLIASPLIWLAVTIAVLGVGGYGVMTYLRHNNATSTNNTDTQNPSGSNYDTGAPSSGGTDQPGNQSCSAQNPCTGSTNTNQQPPVVGKITAFSATSITVQPSAGSAQTLSITSNTQESSGPGKATAYNSKDLHNGESVEVVAGPGNQAMFIVLNHD